MLGVDLEKCSLVQSLVNNFPNIYTSQGILELLLCVSFPGNILAIGICKQIYHCTSSILASETSVNMEIFFQKKLGAGFFGGEGFIMQKFTGNGIVFLEIDGSIVEYNLAPGETMIIDTGYLAVMDSTVSIDIQTVKGVGNVLFGGEGLFNTKLTGPGHVWLQTMPVPAVASSLSPYLIKSN